MTMKPRKPSPRGKQRLKICPVCKQAFEVHLSDLERRVTDSRHCAAVHRERSKGHGTKKAYECACGCGAIVWRYPSQVPGYRVFYDRDHYHASKGRNWKGKPGRKPTPQPVDPTAPKPAPRKSKARIGMDILLSAGKKKGEK